MPHNVAIYLSGYGGQGTRLLGQAIAQTGFAARQQVYYHADRSPDIYRGISEGLIVFSQQSTAFAPDYQADLSVSLHPALTERAASRLRPDGMILYNQIARTAFTPPNGIRVLSVPATAIAHELGDRRLVNTVLFGAVQATCPLLSEDEAVAALRQLIPTHPAHMLALNLSAFRRGQEYAREKAPPKA